MQRVPVGGVVDHGVHARDQGGDGLRVGGVAFDPLAHVLRDVLAAAGRAYECANLMAGAMKRGRGVASDETRGASEGNEHE
jgi:hypothetical protein